MISKKLYSYLRKNYFITFSEAQSMGSNRMVLSRLVAKGELHRIDRQVYAMELDWLTDPLKKYMPVCFLIPEAVICGVSALSYYDLTDEEERKIWISLPHKKRVGSSKYRVIRPSGLALTLGVKKIAFNHREVRIYDMEKTIVDSFKYFSEEVAFKALKRYLKRKDKNIQKLCNYARRLKKPLDEIITILQSEE